MCRCSSDTTRSSPILYYTYHHPPHTDGLFSHQITRRRAYVLLCGHALNPTQWILRNPIDGIIFESFSVTESLLDSTSGRIRNETIDLPIPKGCESSEGGKVLGCDIEVTEDNKQSYVEAVMQWRMYSSISVEMRALARGFHSLIPARLLVDWTVDDLDLVLNGREDVNIDEISPLVRYTGGYTALSPTVTFFWMAMRRFSREERCAVLRFATGTERVPLDGFDPAFTITKAEDAHGHEALPHAHTCFNQLVLPQYRSAREVADKLLFAVKEGVGFELT